MGLTNCGLCRVAPLRLASCSKGATTNYAQQHRRSCRIPPSNIALPPLLSASGLSSQKAQSLRISHKKVPAVALLACLHTGTNSTAVLQHTDHQCVLGFIREQFSEVLKFHIWSDQSSCLAQKEEGLRPRRTPLQHVPHSNQCRHPQSSTLWKMGKFHTV